ncbi:MAG: AbrB/MazE/SpoVT family DNA-binding domain-containing protein [Thermoplasmata archaeon]|nr:AbrB/MazE/SpoVT family DNA-binding domain-containing protein [Thermoplasmata archaeon]
MTGVDVTKVTRKFQITVPKYVREDLNIEKGDFLAVTSNGNEIILKKIMMPHWDKTIEKGEKSRRRKKIAKKKIPHTVEEGEEKRNASIPQH